MRIERTGSSEGVIEPVKTAAPSLPYPDVHITDDEGSGHAAKPEAADSVKLRERPGIPVASHAQWP